MITEPTVRVLGTTSMTYEVEEIFKQDSDTCDADAIAVFAGRSCYESYDRPSASTAKDFDYIQRTLHEQHHYSIAEHASAAFYITGVSRSLTHELVRHRQMGYSQLSQRFVDSSVTDWVCPPEYLGNLDMQAKIENHFEASLSLYNELVSEKVDCGVKRKKAREAARSVLPNCTETKIVVSGNYRAWFEVVGKRYAEGADAEINRLFAQMVPIFQVLAPAIFNPVEV